jgi:hypothetical protein
MKKASLLLAFLFAAFASLVAQEPVTLTFTASTQNGLYCPFDAVNVTNVTRGWTETLAYPDTVLVLTPTVGLEEQSDALNLGKAYPNPFTEETCVLLEMPVACDALLQTVRIDGAVVATCQQHLQAGLHNVKVSLSSPSLAFLMVSTSHGRQVARMVCTGQGSRDGIVVETLSKGQKPSNQPVRSDATGEFQPGDMMRYTSVLFDGANTIYSNTITQQQYENQDVTLYFDLALPEVATNQVTDITPNTATGGGEVIATGGISVTERGICWGTSHNPTTSGSHASNGTGTGSYTVNLSGLSPGTTYYVRAYAINSAGTAYGSEVSFTTSDIPSYTIAVSANPSSGGTVSGSGTYQQGQSCTVTATANTGYTFLRWTENGSQVSTNADYTFTVSGNRTLVAQFQAKSYTISVSANPSNGGSVSGGGSYNYGQSCTVTASANSGYEFTNWTEGGSVVSNNASYSFTVSGNRTLVANFETSVPIGAINGLFTINANGDQVYFSQGNLQYQASTNTWKFADNQYDYVGSNNSNISSTYSGWIDLFGWGTSGYHNPSDPYNVNYQPWSISASQVNSSYNYYGYGPSTNMTDPTLTGTSANYDWGVYNPISNGGNTANQWRTLTQTEWNYVFNTRTTTSGIRYAKANVNNLNGVILLPDDWSSSTYSLSNTNSSDASFSSNTITAAQWTALEDAGVVFLPAAGNRDGTSVGNVGSDGYYWSASCSGSSQAGGVYFSDSYLYMSVPNRYYGFSVRLVRVAEN